MVEVSNSEVVARHAADVGRLEQSLTRQLIVRVATRELSHKAFHEVSLKTVAAAAGLGLGDVTKEFDSWEALVKSMISTGNSQRVVPLLPLAESVGAVGFLRALTVSNARDATYARLLVATVNIAATPRHPLASWLRERYDLLYRHVASALAHDVEIGREPATMSPARGAEQLMALYDGLHIQAFVREDFDLVDAFDRASTRLRRGWAAVYEAPTWNLS